MSKNGAGKVIAGALVGVIAGAVAGVLLAPKSGKETRKELGKKAKDLADKGRKFIDKEKEAVKDMVDSNHNEG